MYIRNLINSIRIKTRESFNPILGKVRQAKLLRKDFTIISNNCWGGHVYRYFNCSYKSPTIGLYFYSPDYVKFVSNLKKYLAIELSFITYEDSKYKEDLIKNGILECPIGVLDDVEIIFLHYKTREEAKEKWERRIKRIVWDNIYFKMSEQNLCSRNDLETFDNLKSNNKVVFVTKDYHLTSQIIFSKYSGKEYIENDTLDFRKYINLTDFLNGTFTKNSINHN